MKLVAALLLPACLGAACLWFGGVDAFTLAVYDNAKCEGDALSKATIEQGKCVGLPGGQRPNSGYYTCQRKSLTKEVWIGSGDCGETGKGYITHFEESDDVGGSSATKDSPSCRSAPWLETGNRWIEIDCASASSLQPTSVTLAVVIAALGLLTMLR